jgi:hypothetical protein
MWLASSLVAFALTVASHAVLCRLPLRTDFVMKAVLCGLPTGILLAGVCLRTLGLTISTAAALLLYAFLFELYVFCFTLVSTSVSVSILLKFAGGGLTLEEVEARYSDKAMLEGRFEKLIRSGFLISRDGGYAVTSKARVILAGFRTMRFFFRHPGAAR